MNSWIADVTYPAFNDHDWVYIKTVREKYYPFGSSFNHYRRYECTKCRFFLNVRTIKDRVIITDEVKARNICINLQMERACE